MKRILLLLLLFSCVAPGQEWDATLTELQRHRVYPHVDKAFRLQQQQHYAAAVTELERALAIVPAHPPLLLQLLELQLAAGQLQAAAATLPLLPAEHRSSALSHWTETVLTRAERPDEALFQQLFAQLSGREQLVLLTALSQRLIAQDKKQQAYFWLTQMDTLPPELRQQRAVLAAELGQFSLASTEMAQLYQQMPSAELAQAYCQVLVQAGRPADAGALANTAPGSAWSAACYRQILQGYIAAEHWLAALELAPQLQQHHALTAEERQQLYQVALAAGQAGVARQYLAQLEVSCLTRVSMLEQADAETDARTQFARCQPQDDFSLWLSYAGRWYSASQLAAVEPGSAAARRQRDELVQQKRIAEQDYASLAKALFAKPLQRRDYPLLLTVTDGLDDKALQLRYFTALYQAMPAPYLLDRLTALQLELDQPELALQQLQAALPFPASAQRHSLAARLLNILSHFQTSRLPDFQVKEILASIADWPDYREQRAELWRLSGDCRQAAALLALAPDTAGGWYTLAMCETEHRPGFALQYWQQLYQLQPEPGYLRQIAYLQQTLQQPLMALHTLQQLPDSELQLSDRFSMAELAQQAAQPALAVHLLQALNPLPAAEQAKKWLLLAQLYQQTAADELAAAAWAQAYQIAPDNPQIQAGYGFFLTAREPERALALLLRAQLAPAYAEDAGLQAQLAFLYQKLNVLEPAKDWAARAVANGNWPVKTDEGAFALLRLQQQLSSPWRFSAGLLLADNTSLADSSSTLGRQLRHSLTVRADYLFNPLQQDLALFALFSTGGQLDTTDTSDITAIQGSQLGISYKPLPDYNIWLSAALEKVPLDSADWQPLLRLSADLLNQLPWQADWHPQQQHWWERRLFTDLAWWPDSGNQLVQLRYEQGKAFRLPTPVAQTLKPYALTQFGYNLHTASGNTGPQLWRGGPSNPEQRSERLWSAGLGLNWRSWFGVALQRKVEVSLEWHYHLDGDQPASRHGWLLQLSTAW